MRKILLSLLSLLSFALLAGCGDSHHSIPIPPNPSGGNPVGFSNASMPAGNYVFTVHGITGGSGMFFAVTGSFTADGAGGIVSGTRDYVDENGGQTLNETIDPATSSYFINQDGRGQLILNGGSGRAIYRFVWQSAAGGSLFQDGDTGSTVITDAVGTIEAQSPFTAPTGAYVVRLDGSDPAFHVYGAIGGITINGSNWSGTLDENDSGNVNANLAATGTLNLSTARGTATLSTPAGPNSGTHHFIVYVVSPTRLELLSDDHNFFLHGSAEAQSSPAASAAEFAGDSPDQVFSIAGYDMNGARVEMGRMTLNSNGTLTNAIEDISTESGLFSGVNISNSTFAVGGANGRWTANLTNSAGAPSPDLVGWQVSPERSIVLTTNNDILETGTMVAQSLASLSQGTSSVSGDFAQRLSGFNANLFSNAELIGNVSLSGGAINGTYDFQSDAAGLNLDNPTSGNYTIDSTTGRSTGSIDGINVTLYAIDPQTIDFLPSTAGSIYQGALVQQQP